MARDDPPGLTDIAQAATPHALAVMGGVHASDTLCLPGGAKTLILLGPKEPGFWPHFTAQPEFCDTLRDPMDRWSRRVIGAMAEDLGAQAVFPFGGAPYHPFQKWAIASGRAWTSPVQLLVHDEAGLMVSYRGALAFNARLTLPPPPAHSPCIKCPTRPCLTACPVGALQMRNYDLPACHGFLDSAAGRGCMTKGCEVRRICPISDSYGRSPEHSAYHMRQFHP